jgi:DNA-binding winged helix-turn-helix (wHTH) protein/tetratricopeptide (TPR) repeat protein
MGEAMDPPVVRFGRFEADLRSGELRFRGARVRLQEQPFRALTLLVERAGQVVTRQELAAALWQDGIHVDFEHGIHTALQKLRRALRDSALRPRWIETVGRRGYRFIGEVESESGGASDPGALRAPRARSFGPATPAFVPGLTPFVGREFERRLLQERFDAAKSGQGQVVLVTGEPGIGKSRLALELAADLGERPHTWLACRGSPQHPHTPFHPIIELLSQGSAEEGDLPLERRWDGFSRSLARAGVKPAEGLPLVSMVLGLAVGDGHAPLRVSPDEARRKLLATLVAWLVGLAKLEPLVVVFEDLHWMDASTLEFLGLLGEAGASAPLLLLLTARPELRAPWPLLAHHTHLTLSRLGRGQVEAMVRSLVPGAALSDEVVEVVVERTEGVPLFVEELTKAVLEAGSEPGALREIPASVRSSLLARLDRLGPAREAAQVGAVIGREFSWALLRAVSQLPSERLDAALSGLVEAELVYRRGLPPQATYTFKHALVQDAAYQSLLESQRRELHGRISDALVAGYPERAAAEPELLARHAEAAGRIQEAIAGYERAGEQARERSAYEEAIRHLRHAIELLATQPEGRERDAHEAAFQLTLGHSLSAARGFAHPEVGVAYERARALAEALGDARGLGRALSFLGVFSHQSGQVERASVLLARVLEIAEETSDADLALSAHVELGVAEHFQGKLASSLAHCETALALHDERHHRDGVLYRAVHALGHASWDLWILGWPDRALARAREAVALARQLGHPFSLGHALMFETVVHLLRRAAAEQRERAAELMAFGEKHGFPFFLGLARTFHAAARVAAGEPEAVADLLPGLAQSGGTGSRAGAPGLLSVVGEAYLTAGRHSEARGAVEGGIALAAQTGQAHMDADLHRLRGEIVLAAGGTPADAEAHFHRALEIARSQEARSYELRAVTSLARLWRDQGRRAEARALLQPVYDWFTEGFDTADLKDAKALLDELRDPPPG